MTVKKSNQIVGKTYNLSVICMVPRDGIMCIMVDFDNKRIAVPMLFSQLGKSLPQTINCKIVSINEQGIPVLQQTKKGELAYLPGFRKPDNKAKSENSKVVAKKDETSVKKTENKSTNTKDSDSSETDSDFIKWRESLKRLLDTQREQQSNALTGNILKAPDETLQVSSTMTDQPIVSQIPELEFKKKGKKNQTQEYECEAHFIEDYIAEHKKLNDFIYQDKSVSFDRFLQSTGTIVMRYKLLIALADFISKYHKTNRIIGDINPSNFEVVSDEPLELKIIDDSLISYKTNMIHQQEGLHYLAPEVKSHLSPITQMSECYSFALLVIHMLTGEEYQGKGEFGKSSYLTNNMIDILCHSLAPDPMSRPKIEEWRNALREGLDGLVYCAQCQQWYAPKLSYSCGRCKHKSKFAISLQVGIFGTAAVYNVKQNMMENKSTMIGNSKGNVILTETTSKVLNGHVFGLIESKDIAIAVISITQCNSNNDITLHIIPIPGNRFTLLDNNYQPQGDSFDKSTDIEIKGEDLYNTIFLLESKNIKNKILKLCQI